MESNAFPRPYGRLSLLFVLLTLVFLLGINSCQQKEELLINSSEQLKSVVIPQGTVVTYWGHEIFNRNTGEPVTIKMRIGSNDLVHFESGFVLHLQNGNGTKNLVSSAIVKIDGKQIFGPSDFNIKNASLAKDITGLTDNSEIEVEVRGTPGNYIGVWIEGTLKPGNAVVDFKGGEFFSDDGLLSLSIPPNTVSEKTFFSATITDITLPTAIPGSIKGPAYLFEPSGIEFESPINVILKYTPELFSNTNNIRIFHWTPALGTYEIIVPVVNVNSHELTFSIDHFSVIGTFELGSSFLNINNKDYVLSDGLLGYYGNFEGKGVYNHSIYLLSPDHNFNFETLVSNGTGAIVSLEIFNTKDYIENGTYAFALPEAMNTVKLCDGTDVNGDGIVNDYDCDYTMPEGNFYISSRLSGYSSNADIQEYQGMEFKSGNVSITKEGEIYTIVLDGIGKNDQVIKAYYSGQLHYYDLSKELYETGTFTDPRDNETYKTVKIGDQWWMAENLRATKFNDGMDIPLVTDNTAWLNSTTPAYCWYNNNFDTYGTIYGALYNWYAVNTGKLAPQGWHVPTDEEWSTLITYLGGSSLAGGKLKENGTSHWNSPNTGATNETGFTALPGGLRAVYNGGFAQVPRIGFWWSTMELDSIFAWNYFMSYYDSRIIRNRIEKGDGLSVRCIRD